MTMATVSEIHQLAEDIHTLHPSWSIASTANRLLQYKHLDFDHLTLIVHAHADDPTNHTPGSLDWMDTSLPLGPGKRESFHDRKAKTIDRRNKLCGCPEGLTIGHCEDNAVPMPAYVKDLWLELLAKRRIPSADPTKPETTAS